jgi:hypothetical protein
LAQFLLNWASAGTNCGTAPIALRLTHEEISQVAGTTRQTVTRTPINFRKRGWVSLPASSLVVHDREANGETGGLNATTLALPLYDYQTGTLSRLFSSLGKLQSQAKQESTGLSRGSAFARCISRYAVRDVLLERHPVPALAELSPKESVAEFKAWTRSHAAEDLPLLSD